MYGPGGGSVLVEEGEEGAAISEPQLFHVVAEGFDLGINVFTRKSAI